MSKGSGARHRGLGIALMTAAGMAVAGCGGSSNGGGGSSGGAGKGDPLAALTAVGGAAAKAKTVSFEGEAVSDGSTEKLTGVLDFSATPRADVTMKTAASADPATSPQSRVIIDGATRYMSAEAFKNAGAKINDAVGAKHWVGFTSGGKPLAGVGTAGGALGVTALSSDPDLVQALTVLLRSGLLKPDDTGKTHYTGTVEPAALGKAAFDEGHRAALTKVLADQHIASEQIEIRLGADGLPTEIKIVDHPDAQLVSGKESKADLHFTGWGKPVTITVPAASDVASFGDDLVNLKFG